MIRSQVVYSRIAAIVRELAETVGRTARSKGLAEGRRYAAAVLTGNVELAAQQQYDASQFYLIRASAAALLDYFSFDLSDGDVVLVADPYHGGSTPQCVTIAAPFFHDGQLVLFPAVRAEVADLAGEYPGTLHPFASETWQEAVRITPVKLYRHGVLQRDVLRFILRNSRAESLVRSDIEAIVSALRAASVSLAALLRDRGGARVDEAIADAIEHGERLALARVAGYGDRDRTVTASVPAPGRPDLKLQARVRIGNGRLSVDFAGTDRAAAAPLNMTLDQARGYVLATALADVLDDAAINDGLLRAIDVTAPAGTALSPALPSATGLSDAVTAHFLVAAIQEALGVKGAAARLDGPAPTGVLFRPIGASADNPPIALDPGFALAGQGWGPPVLAGRRLLPSAEVLETRDGFRLVSRERTDAGIRAVVRNMRGALEGNFLVPLGENGPAGAIVLGAGDDARPLEWAVAVEVDDGAEITFAYPSYADTTP